MKSRIMAWIRHVTRMTQEKNRSLARIRHTWEDIFKMEMDSTGSASGPVEGSCEHGDETLGSTKGG
jgi:hypothetical protein